MTAFHQPSSQPTPMRTDAFDDFLAPLPRQQTAPQPPLSAVSDVKPEPDTDEHWQDPDETPPLGIPLSVVTPDDAALPLPIAAPGVAAPPRRPWFRSTRVLSAAIALAAVAIAVSVVLLFSGNPDAGPGQSKVDSTSTSSAPSPPSVVLAPSAATMPTAPPPPEAPPPPPETAGTVVPQYPQYPRARQSAPSPEQQMPQINVTRTPFSATPPPPQSPQYNQGDGQRAPRRGFGF